MSFIIPKRICRDCVYYNLFKECALDLPKTDICPCYEKKGEINDNSTNRDACPQSVGMRSKIRNNA